MNYYMLIFYLINITTLYAGENKTEHSFRKICSPDVASDEMNKLNNLSKETIDELNNDIEKLNNLEAKKNITNDLSKIKTNYLKSVTTIKPNKFEDALINGMNYEAFRLLLDKNSNEISNLNATNICNDLPNKSNLSFCKIAEKENKNEDDVKYLDFIDQSFSNFKTSLNFVNKNDKETFLSKIKEGYKLLKANPDHVIHQLHESNTNEMPPSMDVMKTEIDASSEELKELAKNSNSAEENAKEIERLKNKINAISSTNGKISKLEKVKTYLRKKIYHNCKNTYKESSLDSNINQLEIKCINEKPDDISGTKDAKLLSHEVGNIISSLRANSTDLKSNGEVGIFLKSELDDYRSSCESISKEIKVSETCSSIVEDKTEIKDQKESKDWDEFHKKYYMVPNPRAKNKKGYDVVEKKSNWKIFSETALPMAIPYGFNLWIDNMMFNTQLDYLTQASIYNKQYNYMMNYNSPWLQTAPYFQGNYYQFNNNSVNNTGFSF